MIRKILKIKSVGKLRDVCASGNVTFLPATLIWAENARGKTTLCDVLRSLATGKPEYLLGRKTLTLPEDIEIQISLHSGLASFANGAWNFTVPAIAVFDDTFVAENVYLGCYVDHAQRKNLYRVIIGSEGIRRAEAVDKLDEDIRSLDGTIRTAEENLRRVIPHGMTTDAFLELENDPDIEHRLQRSVQELESAQQSERIADGHELSSLNPPELPRRLEELLTKSVSDIDHNASTAMRNHLDHHTASANESWIQEGVRYIRADSCPFCAQSLRGVQLIEAYRTYFSGAYRELLAELRELRTEVEQIETGTPGLQLQLTNERNSHLVQFWRQFLSCDLPTVDALEVRAALSAAATAALRLLDEKVQRPLDRIGVGRELSVARESLRTLQGAVATYNTAVTSINALIRQKKEDVRTARLPDLQAEHVKLLAVKARHAPENSTVVDAYLEALKERNRLRADKATAKDALDTYTTRIFRRFENRINKLLQKFGATFRIGRTGRSYQGGKPSSRYSLVINDTLIGVGQASSPLTQPSFRNTLSAGDRSALALAFFVASAELDPDLDQRTLVFDDPFSSQDRSRRVATLRIIRRLAGRAAQIIVLSHDRRFLRELWDKFPPSDRRALQIARINSISSTVSEWDIETETSDEYLRRVAKLCGYRDHGHGSEGEIVRLLRPVLEESLRLSFPGAFPASETLGGYIGRIRDAASGSAIEALQATLEEYEDINEYSRRYHHADGTVASTEAPDAGELSTYVHLTLQLVRAY